VLVDTAGLRKKAKVKENIEFYSNVRTLKAIGDSDIAVILIDAEIGIEKQDLSIIHEAVQRRKGIILAVNKWDLLEKDTNTADRYEKSIKEKLGSIDYLPIIFISAKSKQRIYKLIETAKEVEARRKLKPGTTVLNDILLPELGRHNPPATPTGKEVKIKYITQVGEHYPIFILFANHSKYIPDNYKRFIEKTIRRNFDYTGVPFTILLKDS
jgi:GTP-binding protein